MPQPLVQIVQRTLLVVEGRDEELFFGALLRYLGLGHVQVLPVGGKERLAENLRALSKSPRFSEVICIGVVRDADSDPRAAFESVGAALRHAGLTTPREAMLPAGHEPRVCVMIVPTPSTPGTLEDLCMGAVDTDPAYGCGERYFQCLRENGLPEPRNLSRARIQVFLASRPLAGKRLGEAAQAGYMPWDAGAFGKLKSFLEQVGS
jgi:hypothetical protein